jgi:hypothetical protein
MELSVPIGLFLRNIDGYSVKQYFSGTLILKSITSNGLKVFYATDPENFFYCDTDKLKNQVPVKVPGLSVRL